MTTRIKITGTDGISYLCAIDESILFIGAEIHFYDYMLGKKRLPISNISCITTTQMIYDEDDVPTEGIDVNL